MSDKERGYFVAREQQERRMASRATSEANARLHHDLADRYAEFIRSHDASQPAHASTEHQASARSDNEQSPSSAGRQMTTVAATCGSPLHPDASRVVLRPFHVTDPLKEGDPDARTARIIKRVLSLDPAHVADELRDSLSTLERRHHDVAGVLKRRFDSLSASFDGGLDADDSQAQLISIFFSEEYSFESAALFNPSVVPHFDQQGLCEGATRLIFSLRGVGEGHISSLVFQTGIWHADGTVTVDPRGAMATGPVTRLPRHNSDERTATLTFQDVPIVERVIYPFLPSQGRGIEDARFCQFTEDDGSVDYRCTFTAFDGSETRLSVFTTTDFSTFVGRRLDGDLAFRKGAAWFPRRIDGRYHMLGRLDDESISVMASDDPDCWSGGQTVISPRFPWEFVQMGNCGSPIEIDEGWLVLTHGVGRARKYGIGAALLDRAEPTRLLARSARPILEPTDEDRGGYVPNVVYTCGALLRGRILLMPYGVADNYTAFSTVDIDKLLASMT